MDARAVVAPVVAGRPRRRGRPHAQALAPRGLLPRGEQPLDRHVDGLRRAGDPDAAALPDGAPAARPLEADRDRLRVPARHAPLLLEPGGDVAVGVVERAAGVELGEPVLPAVAARLDQRGLGDGRLEVRRHDGGLRDEVPARGRVALAGLLHPLADPALERPLLRHVVPFAADGLGTHAPDAPPDRAYDDSGVPMARGHLYLRRAGGVSTGTEVGRGTAPATEGTAGRRPGQAGAPATVLAACGCSDDRSPSLSWRSRPAPRRRPRRARRASCRRRPTRWSTPPRRSGPRSSALTTSSRTRTRGTWRSAIPPTRRRCSPTRSTGRACGPPTRRSSRPPSARGRAPSTRSGPARSTCWAPPPRTRSFRSRPPGARSSGSTCPPIRSRSTAAAACCGRSAGATSSSSTRWRSWRSPGWGSSPRSRARGSRTPPALARRPSRSSTSGCRRSRTGR